MLSFMTENVVHFRDDVGTTFVIVVMFLCRVVCPSQCKILLQTAEALELLYVQLGPSFQPRRNRQLYSCHQQMSLTTHLALKCSDLHVHPPPQFRQISSSRAVTTPTL